MIALEGEGQQSDGGVGGYWKKKWKGLKNVSVKYREKVNGIFWEMKDEGQHIETWEGECRAEAKMKSVGVGMTVRGRGCSGSRGRAATWTSAAAPAVVRVQRRSARAEQQPWC